ncbi:hypothetical protein [Agromyces bauzanensis]
MNDDSTNEIAAAATPSTARRSRHARRAGLILAGLAGATVVGTLTMGAAASADAAPAESTAESASVDAPHQHRFGSPTATPADESDPDATDDAASGDDDGTAGGDHARVADGAGRNAGERVAGDGACDHATDEGDAAS